MDIIFFAFLWFPFGAILTIGIIELMFPGSMIFRREPKGPADPD